MIYRIGSSFTQNAEQTIIECHREDGSVIFFDSVRDNDIGEKYRAWIAEGNTPEPAIEPFPTPEPQSEPDHPAT